MAGAIKGITIEIEGKTSPLVKSLQDVETQIKKDDTALKNLEKALELDPTNVDLLAAKEAVLADKTEAVTSKMEILQQVQADALTELPEDSQLTAAQMAELEAEIANTNSTLSELSGEASDAGNDLEDAGDSAQDAGEEASDASEGFETMGEAAQAAGEVAVAAMETVAAAAAAVATAAVAAATTVGTAMVSATTDTATLADEILTLSTTTSLSTDTIQELNYAAELLDTDVSTVTGSMTKLLTKINSATDGSESAMEAFTQLGISIYDSSGNLRSTEDIFWDAIDALGEIENQTERDTTAMDLFGKSALELNPLIEAGSEAFSDLAEEAHNVGYVMDGETLDAFGALDDNLQRLTNISTAVENSIGEILLPLLTDMSTDAVDLLGSFSAALSETDGDIESIGTVIEEFAPQALEMVEEYIPKILVIIEDVLSAILPAIISILPSLVSTVSSLVTTVADSISSNGDEFISAFSELFEAVVNSAVTILPVLIPLAVSLIETLVSALLNQNNLNLLIDCVFELINTLVDTLTDESTLSMITSAASTLVLGLANGLTEILPEIAPVLVDAAKDIILALSDPEVLGEVLIAATNLVEAIGASLVEIAPTLTNIILPLLWNIAQSIVIALPDIIEMIFTVGLDYLIVKWSAILGVFGVQFEDIKGFFELFGLDVTNIVESLVTNLIIWFDDAGEFLSTWFGNAVEGLGEFVADIIEWVVNLGTSIWTNITEAGSNILEWASGLGDDLLDTFSDIASDAVNWGADIIQGIIDGISSMVSSLTSSVSDVASTISDYLHFSVPEKGPLSDFDTSGADMIEEFIQSMDSKQGDLENALTDTAGLISGDIGNFDLATESNVKHTVDYSDSLDGIKQAITAQISANSDGGGTWVFPIYIGNEHVDTLVVDAIDRVNYETGGH